ncbi:protein-methionine sulfoxide oxidase mical3b-like [Nerophis lumbriciformis]|uniref:protein-methionine sulfoxide oxidase mical3b-like n=1 Tax=Nerophis lumbriciformis TaxID=546530 RepID=UPI002AE09CC9|nr:protein-methionine sulfoxide oxidase mical3a-like [Nerophis lumbriciformis]
MRNESYPECRAQELFDDFVSASTCRAALHTFCQMCQHLQLDSSKAERPLYRTLKQRLSYWKANALWAKLDRRASQEEYLRNQACRNATCVVIGAGPCGLRTAVELSFMGARVVVLEKRDSFSRNNVLHLWPFTIHDLRGLGAKKFYGKFCAGSIDHISIRQLQLVLLKVALLLGVEIHVNVEFKRVVEPPDQQHKVGWTMEAWPKRHPVNQLQFHVIIGADGRRNTLPGFRRKEFRGKLAIAITANFKNRNSRAEAKVEEISGVASIFNQRFFQDLRQETGIDLENIVYYKDDTHYFVMTAKKHSLLGKRVILQDFADTEQLLSRANVDQNALQAFARTAANFSTNHQLPSLDFAINHYGQPDVAMFDFTSMYAAENAAMVWCRHGHQLLVTLVGDSLLEPFWPMGTGVARGFLAALDASWMIRRWCRGDSPLDVLAERESVYRLLAQTTPENMQKNFSSYSLDPSSRYVNVCLSVTPTQVRHLVDTGEEAGQNTEFDDIVGVSPWRQESLSESKQLLAWCREQTRGYPGVAVSDLTTSWKSGMALCALVHRYRPDLIDFGALNPTAKEENIRLAFDVCEREFGISPLMTVEEMCSEGEPDSLSMVMYLSQFYQKLPDAPNSLGSQSSEVRAAVVTPTAILCRRSKSCDIAEKCLVGSSRVRLMADLLQAKLDQNHKQNQDSPSEVALGETASDLSSPKEASDVLVHPSSWIPNKRTQQQQQLSFRFKQKLNSQLVTDHKEQGSCPSDVCFFCRQKVYVMERLSAEGVFFHRSCFVCHSCDGTLRLAAYRYHAPSGKFFCPQHCDPSTPTSPSAVKKPRTSFDRASCPRTSCTSLLSSADSHISMATECRRSSVFSVMSVTPERIEVENDQAELAAEISEETLACFNLGALEDVQTSRCEWGVEAPTRGARHPLTSQTSKPAWRDELQKNFQLIGCEVEEEEEDDDEDEEEEEEEDDEDDDEDNTGCEEVVNEDDDGHMADTSDVTSSDAFSLPETSSTASFITKLDSASSTCSPSSCKKEAPPIEVVHLVCPPQRSFDDINLSLKKLRLLQDKCAVEIEWAEPEETGSSQQTHNRRHRYLKGLREAPPPSAWRKGGGGGARALWNAVFARKRNKRNEGGASLPAANELKKDEALTEALTLMDECDLDSSTIQHRFSLGPRNNLHLETIDMTRNLQQISVKDQQTAQPAYVPHALAFKPAIPIQFAPERCSKNQATLQDSDGRSSCVTEVVGVLVDPKEPSSLSVTETLFQREHEREHGHPGTRVCRRAQGTTRRRAKQKELKRLHKAQLIQRQLQLVEEEQRCLEAKGVTVERLLRGEGLHENTDLMKRWFHLVQQKNVLVRYESELMIFARDLQLEDQQNRLQQELRDRMAVEDHLKEEAELLKERETLEEMLEVVEQRRALVPLLEEQRLLDLQEDQNLKDVMISRGIGLDWA